MAELTIQELTKKYKTDKFSGERMGHSYAQFYQDVLSSRTKKPLRLLEIGVKDGESIRLWSELLPEAQIVGIDVQLKTTALINQRNNVVLIQADAYQSLPLQPFDIIIDDGPHTFISQMKAIELYIPKMKPLGVFVIEDVTEHVHIERFQNALPDYLKPFSYGIDMSRQTGRHDNRLFVVET
jgi:trans-aconitate methyltransferase